MAKPKKTDSSTPGAPVTSAPKRKPPAKKPVAEQANPAFDTSLAAETAARMIGAKVAGAFPAATGAEGGADGGKKESSVFKQLKETMAKPHAASMDTLLNNTASQASRRGGQPFGGGKQVGHNQTFGADVARRNLPRRTGG